MIWDYGDEPAESTAHCGETEFLEETRFLILEIRPHLLGSRVGWDVFASPRGGEEICVWVDIGVRQE